MSTMKAFTIALSNGETVAGIHNIPVGAAKTSRPHPLVVALHGGNYECHYFDADPIHTASISSTAYNIPFIAIDRPCYGGSSSFLPVSEDSSFPRETGLRLHQYILPALWSEFGVSNNCNCIVLLNHSLGVMAGIPAAAMHGQDNSPLYPLGGIVCSGLGDVWQPHMYENHNRQVGQRPTHLTFPPEVKDAVMFSPGTVHDDILKLTSQLHHPAPFPEVKSLPDQWLPNWKNEWAAYVQVPVLFTLVTKDPFFVVSEERLKSCQAAFSHSSQVSGDMIRYAPHCMELSHWSQSWYARCFGFALECSTIQALDEV